MRDFRKFIYTVVSIFVTVSLIYMFFIAIIDPFYVFHMPIGGMDAIKTSKAHYVARGLIRNADYEMLICGSSMCENFHIYDANRLFYGGKSKSLKVVQHGSYSNDLRVSLEAAAEAEKAKNVIMALDTSIFQKPDTGYRSDIPSYTIDQASIFNIWPYLLNKDVFECALDLILQNNRGDVPSQDSWWIISEDIYSEESLLTAYKNELLDSDIREFDEIKAWNNLKNIEKGVAACQKKGIDIQFFIPPYSIANWDYKDYKKELIIYKQLWSKLLEYSNVSIYAIQFDGNIVTDFNNYRNLGHYSEKVCREILQDLHEGKYQLTLNNIDCEVDDFIKLLDMYDWESLRKNARRIP